MNKYYPHLFTPIKIGDLTMPNRFEVAPTARKDLTDLNHHSLNNKAYFRMLASSGASIVTVGDCPVHPSGSVEYSYKVPLFDFRCECGLNEVADGIHREGAYASIELQHVGVHFTAADRINYGPSPMISNKGFEVVEMPREVIQEITDAYGKAAQRAKKCDFDMCLLHIGHGWLLSQFLSPAYNRRTDEFGGSVENRARIVIMAVDKIRKYCGKDFPIAVRLSYEEAVENGYTLDDMIKTCKLLDDKVDLFQVSHGSLDDDYSIVLTSPSMYQKHALNLEAATEIKRNVKTPVSVVGNIYDLDVIDKAVADGKVDMFAMARSYIADNKLVKKARKGLADEIRPCLKCNTCLDCGYENITLRCAVNPDIGRDFESLFVKPEAEDPVTVLIAGGGPAGMQAAQTAVQRGHKVILCEKESTLGGMLNAAGKESFKNHIRDYCAYMIRQTKKAGVDIRLNTPVTPELIEEINPDAVICAIGSEPVIPNIKGVDKALEIVDLYNNNKPVGDRVAVIGAGLVGCEAAIGFAMEGKDVTIIEMGDDYTSGATEMKKMATRLEMKTQGVKLMLSTKCLEITDEGVIIENKDGKSMFKADTIVMATGFKPKTVEVDSLMKAADEFMWIGDCRKVAQIEQAVASGYDAAMRL